MPRGSNTKVSEGRLQLCCASSWIPCQLAAGYLIGLVLYWGRGKWKQPRSVAEYFSPRELPLETWKYINDFHLQVFTIAALPKDVRKHFSSDMRIVVDYLAEGKDYKPSDQKIQHMEAFLLLMRNLTGDVR